MSHDHSHDHEHSHDHDDCDALAHMHLGSGAPINESDLDPASRSLSEALRVSFGVLKWIMAFLLVTFVLSGMFYVKEGQVAITTFCGKIVGGEDSVVRPGGPHFAFPKPLGEIIYVPTTERAVRIDKAFWFNETEEQSVKPLDEKSGGATSITPGQDGCLITGDKNVVHGKWEVTYRIQADEGSLDPIRYAQNVGSMGQADSIVTDLAESSLIHVVARSTADDFVNGKMDHAATMKLIQTKLDRIKSGITVINLSLSQPTAPLSIRSAFLAVGSAQNEKANKIEQAERDRSKRLNEVAGAGYQDLLHAIDAYEVARRSGDSDKIDAKDSAVTQMLQSGRLGGRVSEMISEANTYRTSVKEGVRAEADRFKRLVTQFDGNSQLERITRNRLWQDTRQQIMLGDVETFYLPSGVKDTLVVLNRDPELARKKERERYKQETADSGHGEH